MSDVNKLDDCMLSFDLKIGTGDKGTESQSFGYQAIQNSSFGELTKFQSTIIGIEDLSGFIYWDIFAGMVKGTRGIQLTINTNRTNLLVGNLEVTVDGLTYYLGVDGGRSRGAYPSGMDLSYLSGDSQKLCDLLKQNVGNTLHFCFNWRWPNSNL
ncbi:DUF7823 domain-containing protein [Xenorhabdus stockiae]|uniref:DUF7823 domain-containing protein n=1 Tax=Xenorhabdus stockiae TaxID=351614 RepID=UPI004062EA85